MRETREDKTGCANEEKAGYWDERGGFKAHYEYLFHIYQCSKIEF